MARNQVVVSGVADYICGAQVPSEEVMQIGDDDDDSDSEDIVSKRAKEANIILPTDPWKESWDLGVLVLILYSAIVVPYRICFDSPATGFLFGLEQLITLAFMIDVYLNFNTAHASNDLAWVLDRKEIACRYLSGWFWIDAPACVPVELLDALIAGEQQQMGLLDSFASSGLFVSSAFSRSASTSPP